MSSIRMMFITVIIGFVMVSGSIWADGNDTPGNALTITSGAGNGVIISDAPEISPEGTTQTVTWEFWIRRTEDTGSNTRIVATKWDGSTGIVVTVGQGSQGPTLYVGINRVPDPFAGQTGIDGSTGALSLDRWQHVAIRYVNAVGTQNDNCTVYKNGVEITSKIVTNDGSATNTANLVLGDDPNMAVGASDVALGCQIDEFRVWADTGATASSGGNRDQGEIQANMHLAQAISAGSDLLGAHYSFNGDLTDSTSNTSVSSSQGIDASSASGAAIGKSITKTVSATGVVSFDDGGSIDTGLALNITSISGSVQLTVARIPAPVPDLPRDTTNISSSQYWIMSHEGSQVVGGTTPTDAVTLTADVKLSLANETGINDPDTLALLEASYATGADDWDTVSNADDAQTDAGTAVFTNLTIFSTTTAHLADVWTLGGGADNPLPVDLTSFIAQVRDGAVMLQWATASESQNLGFNVYRSESPNGPFTKLNSYIIAGLGTVGAGKEYHWVDENVDPGVDIYYYYVEDTSFFGTTDTSRVIPVKLKLQSAEIFSGTLIPEESALLQNYPNAFNPDTWIPFQLSETANVILRIYGVTGTLVRTIELGQREPGYYLDKSRAIYWDGRNARGEHVGSGTYYYSLIAGDFAAMRRMILLK